MTVLADDGGLYRGPKAWIMCLWALKRYRARAHRLASPGLWPLAKSTIDWISRNRKWP